MKLNELTIKEAVEGLKNRQFSSRELVKACFLRIKEVDSKVKAFITVCEKEAREEAERIDREMGSVRDLGELRELFNRYPLLGIPFSIKDVYSTSGIKTTAGSKVLENYIPAYNATVYQKLINAGAILVGKTNCDAWGHGSSTENSDFGSTKNPWDLKRVSGGSSGGEGAAISSDMSLFGVGEDTGGSIRLPASFCSVVGMKVTYGRTSRYGAIAYASSLDSVGPMAKNVEDCALLLEIIAGKDDFDASTSSKPVNKYTSSLKKEIKNLKIGIPKEYFVSGTDKNVKNIIEKAIKVLENLGAKTIDISLPMTPYAIATYYLIATSETSSNLGRYDGVRYGNNRSVFGEEAKRRIMLGTYTLSAGYYDAYYLKAMKVRTLIKKDFKEAFKKVDVILAPTSPTLPFKLGEKSNDPLAMYLSDIFTVTANLAGIPALAIPCGFVDNLPVGLQMIGPQFSEKLLFQVGYAYEQRTQWYKIKPKL